MRSAAVVIQSLQPRPAAPFQRREQAQYLLPDVFVEEKNGELAVCTCRSESPAFHINGYYRELLSSSDDREIRAYLAAKLRQAEDILRAVAQRESTLLRCAQIIACRQSAFFRLGPSALRPLRMADVARELGVHESTVSRTAHQKYLQCSQGMYPLSYFFSRSTAPAGELSRVAAQTLLRQLIDSEDPCHPLSDQKLSELMARRGSPISRRTAAKYREELGIPSAAGRKGRAE